MVELIVPFTENYLGSYWAREALAMSIRVGISLFEWELILQGQQKDKMEELKEKTKHFASELRGLPEFNAIFRYLSSYSKSDSYPKGY